MTDAPVDPVAPAAPVAAPQPPSGMPATPAAFNSPEAVAARAQIATHIQDVKFRERLMSSDQEVKSVALGEWTKLHKTGYPVPEGIASQDDVNAQAAARNAEQWNSHIGWVRERMSLTAEQEAEIRGGVVPEAARRWAEEQKNLLVKDKGFYRRLLDGDRAAKKDWTIVTEMLALRPVKP
jgi:hypothetical protein